MSNLRIEREREKQGLDLNTPWIMAAGISPLLSLRQLSGLRCWRNAVSLRPLHTSPAVLSIQKLPAGRHTIPESRAEVGGFEGYPARLFGEGWIDGEMRIVCLREGQVDGVMC